MQVLSGRKGIADLEVTGVGQTYDVSGKGFINRLFLLRHETGRCGESHLLVLAHMIIIGVTQELTATDLKERNTGSMVRIHVCVNLKAERRKLIFHRFHYALFGCYRKRGGCILYEKIQ